MLIGGTTGSKYYQLLPEKENTGHTWNNSSTFLPTLLAVPGLDVISMGLPCSLFFTALLDAPTTVLFFPLGFDLTAELRFADFFLLTFPLAWRKTCQKTKAKLHVITEYLRFIQLRTLQTILFSQPQ